MMTRKKDQPVEWAGFRLWLGEIGCTLYPTKGEWEVLRWEWPTGDGPRMLYKNKLGKMGGFSSPDAEDDWLEYLDEQLK
jgi:hypothetical protein